MKPFVSATFLKGAAFSALLVLVFLIPSRLFIASPLPPIVSLLSLGVLILFTVTRPVLKRELLPFVCFYSAFLAWCIVSLIWTRNTYIGLQNITIYTVLFFGTVAVANNANDIVKYVHRTIIALSLVGIMMGLISFALDGFDGRNIYESRPFSMLMVFLLAWLCAFAAMLQDPKDRLVYAALSVGIICTLFITLSRTALFTAIVIVLMTIFYRPGSFKRTFVALAAIPIAVLVGGYFAIQFIPALHDRFMVGDVYDVGGIAINTSGRIYLWTFTFLSWTDSLSSIAWGKGVGSIEALMLASIYDIVAHPHNEYLRLLHDVGLFGFSLWLIAIINLFKLIYSKWKKCLEMNRKDEHSRYYLAAVCALGGFCFLSIFTNPIIYIFIAIPLSYILGIAVGRQPPKYVQMNYVRLTES
jgi:O-antigen ligase